jgi:hypothetical protein
VLDGVVVLVIFDIVQHNRMETIKKEGNVHATYSCTAVTGLSWASGSFTVSTIIRHQLDLDTPNSPSEVFQVTFGPYVWSTNQH